jgi:hypothetical protein
LACGAVLLPAASAFAEDMPAMKDGMMCPHAVGDMTNPATAAPPMRSAPNEAPLGAKPAAVVTQPSPGRAATKPASKAPGEGASATTPATTTATSKAGAGAAVRATQPQRAVTPVAAPQRAVTPAAPRPVVVASTPKAKAPAHRTAAPKHSAPARPASSPVIPEVTRPSGGNAPQVPTAATATQQPGLGWVAIGGALMMLIAFAGAIRVLRRRGSGGAVVTAAANGPLEPSLLRLERAGFDEVEIALREMLSEARASELLNAESDSDREAPLVMR